MNGVPWLYNSSFFQILHAAPLTLSNTHADGSNLNFSGFTVYTIGANVEANGGGLNFTGAFNPNTGAMLSSLKAATGQSLAARNGGWGLAQDLTINALPFTVDATSSYSLNHVTVTNSILTYGVAGLSGAPSSPSLLTDVTLSGSGSVLKVFGNQSLTLDTASVNLAALTLTGGAQLQLAGDGGHQILSSEGTANLAKLVVNSGSVFSGAGNTAAHQIKLTLGSTGKLAVTNPNLPTTGVNLADAPLLSVPAVPGTPLAGSTAHQSLTLLGDIQMAANSTLEVTIFGNNTNANSLLMAGSAGTPVSTLAGNLSVVVAPGLNLTGNTLFVVFQENGAGYGPNRFANVPVTGSTLTSADGNWLFGVNYIGNQVILGNPTAVPEPSTYALFAGLVALGWMACRRQTRQRSATEANPA